MGNNNNINLIIQIKMAYFSDIEFVIALLCGIISYLETREPGSKKDDDCPEEDDDCPEEDGDCLTFINKSKGLLDVPDKFTIGGFKADDTIEDVKQAIYYEYGIEESTFTLKEYGGKKSILLTAQLS